MSERLSGKVALVTGGSRGIGAAIVRRFSAEGAAVAFTYSASAQKAEEITAEIKAAGGRALAIRADSGNVSEVQQAVAETIAAFGRLDILVNNAGIQIYGDVAEFPIEDFDRMFAVNVRAAFVAAQSAVRHMGDGGRIITIGSVTGDRAGFPTASVYSMTKGAVAAMTRGLARDLGPRGITVNNIQPGPTATDMNAGQEKQDFLKTLLPVGRLGTDSEIAGLAAYLASPEASFVTGASLTIDGGYLA
ncbi:3-oxoacyl-ACP reductase family protein [Rhizobium sp. BK251]|uniref:3-oxoacyl-ACP reductase family protein n=1 Tax=Rhizobium sp. BK251 TaxID=2512125 RepID=UPI00104E0250|nr:3-oxoacyl-ACP reductase family protein [Rhizobium sp. BK251]TCL69756.1 3-oxoacyl-[acyl-carrier protein] reductase [Rhizobium sp. BK251]